VALPNLHAVHGRRPPHARAVPIRPPPALAHLWMYAASSECTLSAQIRLPCALAAPPRASSPLPTWQPSLPFRERPPPSLAQAHLAPRRPRLAHVRRGFGWRRGPSPIKLTFDPENRAVALAAMILGGLGLARFTCRAPWASWRLNGRLVDAPRATPPPVQAHHWIRGGKRKLFFDGSLPRPDEAHHGKVARKARSVPG
jgi:hypothetical protein